MSLSKVQGAQIETPVDISGVNLTGVSTAKDLLVVGSGATSGTADQALQVLSGTYISGNIGVGTVTPLSYDDTGGGTRHLKIHRDGGVTRRGVLDLGAHQDTQGAFLGSIWWTNAANSSGSGTTQSRLACAIDVTANTVSTNAGAGSGADFKILTKSEGGTLQQRLVVEAGGHVGVATTNPVYDFQVGGNIGCGIYTKQDGVFHVFNDVNNAYGRFFHDGTGLFVDSASNGTYYPLTLKTSNNQALKIETDGNFVIRSSSSYVGEQLGRFEWWNENDAGIMAKIACHREASANAPGALTFHTSTNVDTATNGSEGELSEKMRITSAGLVGIGISTPTSDLTVLNTNAGGNGALISIQNRSTTSGSKCGIMFGVDTSDASWADVGNAQIINENTTGSIGSQLKFYCYDGGNNEAMKIAGDGTGNVRNGVAFARAGVALDNLWDGYPGIHVFHTDGYSNTANRGEFRFHGYSSSYSSYPGTTGSDFSLNLRIDGSTYHSSDRRHKTNIVDNPYGLDEVLQLQPRKFNRINSSGEIETDQGVILGFIAQEVNAVIPEAVKYYSEEDVPNENGFCRAYALNESHILSTLVNAVKEQNAVIESLKTRIEALEP